MPRYHSEFGIGVVRSGHGAAIASDSILTNSNYGLAALATKTVGKSESVPSSSMKFRGRIRGHLSVAGISADDTMMRACTPSGHATQSAFEQSGAELQSSTSARGASSTHRHVNWRRFGFTSLWRRTLETRP